MTVARNTRSSSRKAIASAEPITSFRVYPRRRRSGLYARVRIWRTQAEMHDAANVEDQHTGRSWSALVRGKKVNVVAGKKVQLVRDYVKPIFADMFFCETSLGAEVIAHESAHAALRYCGRIGVNISADPIGHSEHSIYSSADPEEVFAYACGYIANEIVRRARLAGISAAKVWIPK